MANKKRTRALPSHPSDLLRKEHGKYLRTEFEQRYDTPPILSYLARAPYPLDADTAGAVQGVIDNFVLPRGIVGALIEEWAYPKFAAEAAESRQTLLARGNPACPPVPELEMLQFGDLDADGRRRAKFWYRSFDEYCESHRRHLLDGLLPDHPELAARYVQVPFMPLGWGALSYVPLLEGHWIDSRLIELIEAGATMRNRGFTRLPSRDSHSMAWHRFFPRSTRWRHPKEASRDQFLGTLHDIERRVRAITRRRKEICGRNCIHVDDYQRWKNRSVPDFYFAVENRRISMSVQHWNRWIRKHAVDGRVVMGGHIYETVESPMYLNKNESIDSLESAAEAEELLRERQQALGSLFELLEKLPPVEESPLSPRQRRILELLRGHQLVRMTWIAESVGISRETLSRSGELADLCSRRRVVREGSKGFRLAENLAAEIP